MKVLVISHNVFSSEGNMGKTLSSYFENYGPDRLAQFYISNELPNQELCKNYYRITDREALISIFTRKCGKVLHTTLCEKKANNEAEDKINKKKTKLIKKRPIIFVLRNLVWKFSAWKSKKIFKWVDEFSPNVIFFAAGDYSFIYEIALKIAEYKKIPLIMCCMDDYYLNNCHKHEFLGQIMHRHFLKVVKKNIDYCSCIMTISDKMNNDYSRIFNKKCITLHTSSNIVLNYSNRKNRIVYLGNLGLERYKQIIKLGRALKKINLPNIPTQIDVYSNEKDINIIKELSVDNGICFYGKIESRDVYEVMLKSKYVLHVESFDEDIIKRVKYSVSTKIADALGCGALLLAFGPSNIASIEYLKKNNAAWVIDDEDTLQKSLEIMFKSESMYKNIIDKANILHEQNHNLYKNSEKLLNEINCICKNK